MLGRLKGNEVKKPVRTKIDRYLAARREEKGRKERREDEREGGRVRRSWGRREGARKRSLVGKRGPEVRGGRKEERKV